MAYVPSHVDNKDVWAVPVPAPLRETPIDEEKPMLWNGQYGLVLTADKRHAGTGTKACATSNFPILKDNTTLTDAQQLEMCDKIDENYISGGPMPFGDTVVPAETYQQSKMTVLMHLHGMAGFLNCTSLKIFSGESLYWMPCQHPFARQYFFALPADAMWPRDAYPVLLIPGSTFKNIVQLEFARDKYKGLNVAQQQIAKNEYIGRHFAGICQNSANPNNLGSILLR